MPTLSFENLGVMLYPNEEALKINKLASGAFYKNKDTVKDVLVGCWGNEASATQLDYLMTNLRDEKTYKCNYLLLNASKKEVTIIRGFTRGYAGEGPRATATMNCWLHLLRIPKYQAPMPRDQGERFFKDVGEIPANLTGVEIP